MHDYLVGMQRLDCENLVANRYVGDGIMNSAWNSANRFGKVNDSQLVEGVEFLRADANRRLDPVRRSELGQFMTPSATSRLMASMFEAKSEHIRLLDAGAGVGSLTAAFVEVICGRRQVPLSIHVDAYEIEDVLIDYLGSTLRSCRVTCGKRGVDFKANLISRDFIDEGVRSLRSEMFRKLTTYNCAILNPPYKKINSDSEMRRTLREVGVETSNLYTAFLSIAMMLLEPGGELVAITPRSFCNGPYFKPFRQLLLKTLTIHRIHVFESRHFAFREDEVLQENVIFYGVKEKDPHVVVTIASSTGPEDEYLSTRKIQSSELVRKDDPDFFIHIVPDEIGASVAQHMGSLEIGLEQLGLEVSTGRVVDFRATHLLRQYPDEETAPLIYPLNFENGYIEWPRPGKKAQAMALLPGHEVLLIPKGVYVLVKRFSSKEENRRIVAAVYDPERVAGDRVGFENHTNYYHCGGSGIPMNLARGLAAFLNSTIVDMYFRQFNGHTQVNAGDLRSFKYPSHAQLLALGSRIANRFPEQQTLDRIVEEEIFALVDKGVQPVRAKAKTDEALAILKDLGLPKGQQNERSALTLLALLGLKPSSKWSDGDNPLMGIRPMMDYFKANYGKTYAENSRESVRRFTIHQFLDAGIVTQNPDDPSRPINSEYTVYQIESGLLELLRTYGTDEYDAGLKTYLASTETLKKKYAQERAMKRIPIEVEPGKTITLSPGGQNILVERIVADFCEYFTSGGMLVYVGDTDEKWAYFNESLLGKLGVSIDTHGKMPDVIIYSEQRNWLILIEAVTSHGPVNPKRRGELKALFESCTAGLVYVTAFLDRQAMMKYLAEISWETEVWVADAPTHLIHFNGERFLGPYEGGGQSSVEVSE